MDKFTTLQPTRLYNSVLGKPTPKPSKNVPKLIGRLPTDVHLLILNHLPIPDFPNYSLASRAAAVLTRNDKIWEKRWKALGVEKYGLQTVLDDLDAHKKGQVAASRAAAPPTIAVDDDFGDFASGDLMAGDEDEMGDFVGGFDSALAAATSKPAPTAPTVPVENNYRNQFIRAHNLLKPLTKFLNEPPHVILSSLASTLSSSLQPSIRQEALALCLLSSYLSPLIQPIRQWSPLHSSLRSAMDRFDANLLAAFDMSDGKSDESGMREAAESSWLIWVSDHNTKTSDWDMGKVWAEKREIFYESKGDPLDNFTKSDTLDFDPMDEFMGTIRGAIVEHGSIAVRVFPPESDVLVMFAERVANEVVGEYISSLLLRAREISTDTYLKAVAATFREAWRMVDAIMQAATARETPKLNVVVNGVTMVEKAEDNQTVVSRTRAEDVVYQMFEQNMDEYLDEEVEATKLALERICKGWQTQVASTTTPSNSLGQTQGRFLASHNPAQVKRNVLASFTDVLLLPVTIVPRTVGAVGGAIVSGSKKMTENTVQGIAMLNPARWGAGTGAADEDREGYLRGGDGDMVFEIGEEDDEDEKETKSTHTASGSTASTPTPSLAPSTTRTSVGSMNASSANLDQMDLLLSLDVALELIHMDRESLKRVETFAGYPGHYGHRVRDTIEEIFILMLSAMGEGHVTRGFEEATRRMTSYQPAEHEETTSVAPLLQFFELVHIGDTIQSMVQVYFDKELAPHIDRTDFLNAVVREKKRFENALDDCVAGGLNAGTEVLMNQVEHIINKLTQPREYYPPEGADLELGPTKGCTEAIKCLEMHCKLLKGSTSKEVLEVFHQEVGIRLIAILQKHIKRQIISLNGGFQVIADLNAYHAFITSLKVPSIAADFSHLKMLGHVYVVEDAKDLAQIVRDVTRYGGAYRPEDIYEFIQRRSDWKKIEKTVDKTMYNLSFKEDCVIC
ncbi:f-box protein pof6 [Moniliophthora roreri MCA 2997]|uniref:F-box protein pof6 n=2 Tax=Moniliophthora roreri TaxID=221103 RepID=V2X090_MONRO|nr:f-box protein pof6 [Moniliophthora roreri MCA 2997]KAI3610007.1 f-box protein pof6 [Moniliophthora roreri]